MVTVITATGNPIIIPLAQDARVENGRLVCLDAAGQRLLTFDPMDVTAYAVEQPGWDTEWVLGGPGLAMQGHQPPRSTGLLSRLPSRLRSTA
jgi:hypothetical protein